MARDVQRELREVAPVSGNAVRRVRPVRGRLDRHVRQPTGERDRAYGARELTIGTANRADRRLARSSSGPLRRRRAACRHRRRPERCCSSSGSSGLDPARCSTRSWWSRRDRSRRDPRQSQLGRRAPELTVVTARPLAERARQVGGVHARRPAARSGPGRRRPPARGRAADPVVGARLRARRAARASSGGRSRSPAKTRIRQDDRVGEHERQRDQRREPDEPHPRRHRRHRPAAVERHDRQQVEQVQEEPGEGQRPPEVVAGGVPDQDARGRADAAEDRAGQADARLGERVVAERARR